MATFRGRPEPPDQSVLPGLRDQSGLPARLDRRAIKGFRVRVGHLAPRGQSVFKVTRVPLDPPDHLARVDRKVTPDQRGQ